MFFINCTLRFSVTHVTKRTRIIRKTIIDEYGNKRVVEQEVPIEDDEEEPFTVIDEAPVQSEPELPPESPNQVHFIISDAEGLNYNFND